MYYNFINIINVYYHITADAPPLKVFKFSLLMFVTKKIYFDIPPIVNTAEMTSKSPIARYKSI